MLVHFDFVHAATIVNDTWQDGTDSDPASPMYSENGTDSDTDDDIESAWFQGGDGSLDPVGAGGPLTGTVFIADRRFISCMDDVFYSGGITRYSRQCGRPSESHVGLHSYHYQRRSRGRQQHEPEFPIGSCGLVRPLRALSPMAHLVAATYTGYGMFMNMGAVLGNSNPFRLLRARQRTAPCLARTGDWLPSGQRRHDRQHRLC